MTSKLLLFCIFFSIICSKAQFLQETGYFTKHNGEKVYAKIKVIDGKKIKVKDGEGKKYFSPDSIAEVYIDSNNIYVSKNVKIGTNIQNLFLKELISGNAKLYQTEDSTGQTYYFIQRENGKIRRLNALNYEFMTENLLIDCDTIKNIPSNIEATSIHFNRMVSNVINHNKSCNSVENPFKVRFNRKREILIGVKAGVGVTNKDFYEKPLSTNFSLGMIFLIPISNYFSIQPEFVGVIKTANLNQVELVYKEYYLFYYYYYISKIEPSKPTYQLQINVPIAIRTKHFKYNPFIKLGPNWSINDTYTLDKDPLVVYLGLYSAIGVDKIIGNNKLLQLTLSGTYSTSSFESRGLRHDLTQHSLSFAYLF